MPKDQFRHPALNKQITCVQFTMNSAEEIQQNSRLRISSKNLYQNQHQPEPYGVLDRRLGVGTKDAICHTCRLGLNDCIGHFGYVELALPVYHIGHFRSIMNVLKMICKYCARILAKDSDRLDAAKKMANPNLSYLTKKAVHKRLLLLSKRVSRCPHCQENNGEIRKGSGLLKIIHDIKRKRKLSTKLAKDFDQMLKASSSNIELIQALATYNHIVELTPLSVLHLFKNIPKSDVPLLGMTAKNGHPMHMILTHIFVPPACIRPSVISEFKIGTNEDDLTMKLSEILLINDVIQRHTSSGGKIELIHEDWEFLQLHVSLYFNSQISGIPGSMVPKKHTRGIVQRLKGKHGRFRGNLSGKRVDFSARTVISPDPTLQVFEVGVPMKLAKILTYPERVNKANIALMRKLVRNGPYNHPGANYVQQYNSAFKKFLAYGNREKVAIELRCGDIVERHLQNNDIVLFNRQPSLHKLSIMAHRVRLHNGRTFRFNEASCLPYNADFDGDEMNIHLPQTEEARAEALILMGNQSNLVTPKNGEIQIAGIQDFITSAYLLTCRNEFLTKEHFMQLVSNFFDADDINMQIELPIPAIIKPRRLWTGKQAFNILMRPNKLCPVKVNLITKGKNYTTDYDLCKNESWIVIRNSEIMCGSLDKVILGVGSKDCLFYVILRQFGEQHAVKCIWRLTKLTSYFIQNRGFTFGISDVTPSRKLRKVKRRLLEKGYRLCNEYIESMVNGELHCQPGCTPYETLEALILRELSNIREQCARVCLKDLRPENSALIMAESGSKGSNINISQMIICVGQQAVDGKRAPNGFLLRSLPIFKRHCASPSSRGFVQNSFFSGLKPYEFFFHSMAGREGLVDTAVKTAETGYLQRRLVKCLEDLVVQYDGSVRNCCGEVIETIYGADGLDPLSMETEYKPVNMLRHFNHIRCSLPCRDEPPLEASEIMPLTKQLLNSNEFLDSRKDCLKETHEFIKTIAESIGEIQNKYKDQPKLKHEIERLTSSQLRTFLQWVHDRYNHSVIEPGTAVGAVAAQSIGEPGTQMTLKTFHFAGVATMSITQGVPRVVEIINALRSISTPIITADLFKGIDLNFARQIKSSIERTTLGEICTYIGVVYTPKYCAIRVCLNLQHIGLLGLKVNAKSVKESICKARLRIRNSDIHVIGDSVLVIILNRTRQINLEIARLIPRLKKVIVSGLSKFRRAVIIEDDRQNPPAYKICVEGEGILDVLSTFGVEGSTIKSNNIMEVFEVFGIEAARSLIMSEITTVLEGYGMSVDVRHINLLASQMTARGEVLGMTRHGLVKMRESVFNLASFERTADHLFDAAYYGQMDNMSGVSERIILGLAANIGTGIFKLLHHHEKKLPPVKPSIFEDANIKVSYKCEKIKKT